MAACWEEQWSDGSELALLPIVWGCCLRADTAEFATSSLVAEHDSSHENLDLEVVVSVDVLETQGS